MNFKELLKREKKEVDTKSCEPTYACRFYTPDVDIVETESEIVLYADVPGVNKKDVEITVENNTLKLNARIDTAIYQGLRPIYSEYNLGHYGREFTLDRRVDKNSIAANLENGVLTLRLKKAQEVLPRRIEIQ